ncbi:metallophosphoesterase [Albirhodobacter sp. R86504]|uniref:metallophosphoesterase n=1 Tax=Albirhodobacter sp. R86504 TaxID=3093848 RepID=UPI0036735187
MRTYAIGDIHGHLNLLTGAHELIEADRARHADANSDAAPVVHVGDLCDRGPDSKGVIDHLIAGEAAGAPWIVLKGNHDRMFTIFMQDPFDYDPCLRRDLTWIHPRLGGPTTLASYGVVNPADRPLEKVHAEACDLVPQAHLDWLNARPTYFARDEALFVHAGIRPGVALADQKEDDLLWIRPDFLESSVDHGPLVVHGHTAIEAATLYPNRLNIDSSAAYGGPLSAVVIEGRNVWLLTQEGRKPLSVHPIPEQSLR